MSMDRPIRCFTCSQPLRPTLYQLYFDALANNVPEKEAFQTLQKQIQKQCCLMTIISSRLNAYNNLFLNPSLKP